MTNYDTDFYTWTQEQAAALRARYWVAVDVEHVAEEIEDLWKGADHDLTGLLLGFLELIYRPCADELGQYHWQSAVIDYHRSMLESWLEESPNHVKVSFPLVGSELDLVWQTPAP